MPAPQPYFPRHVLAIRASLGRPSQRRQKVAQAEPIGNPIVSHKALVAQIVEHGSHRQALDLHPLGAGRAHPAGLHAPLQSGRGALWAALATQ